LSVHTHATINLLIINGASKFDFITFAHTYFNFNTALMKQRTDLLWVFIFLLTACNNKGINFDASIIDNAELQIIQTELIKKDIDCIYPIKLIKYDSIYAVQNLGSDKFVNLLDKDGEYMKCIIKRGEAPNEIADLSSTISMNNNLITLYSNPYYVEYDLKKILKGENDYCRKIKKDIASLNAPVSNVRKIKDRFLYEGFTTDMRFALSNTDGSYLKYNEYPPILGTSASAKETAAVMSYASKVYVHPQGERWLQVNYIGATMEIFKEENEKITPVKQLFIYPSIYEGNHSQVTWGNNSIIGFDDVTVTPNYIYALLNGAKGKDLKSMPPVTPFGNRIIKMDWEGNIIQVIKTDCMVMAFDVDEVNCEYYLISYNGEEGFDLRKFKI